MLKSMQTEKAKLKIALRIATAALAFYANPNAYLLRRSNPVKTLVITIDGGMLARMTLADLAEHLDEDAQQDLRRYQLMAGEE